MKELLQKHSAILGLFVFLGLATLGYQLGGAAVAVKAMERTVVVKGLSEREVPANVASWPITYKLAGNNLETLFASLESNARLISKFLAGYGIEGADISLSPPMVTDLFAQEWGNKQDIKYRYTATGQVTVHSENVAAVRDAMAHVVALGKQGIVIGGTPQGPGNNQFLFTGLNALKPGMIEEATKNARAVAEKFAADSNSKLGKIKSARQGQFSIANRDATTPHIKKVRVVSTVEYYLAD